MKNTIRNNRIINTEKKAMGGIKIDSQKIKHEKITSLLYVGQNSVALENSLNAILQLMQVDPNLANDATKQQALKTLEVMVPGSNTISHCNFQA